MTLMRSTSSFVGDLISTTGRSMIWQSVTRPASVYRSRPGLDRGRVSGFAKLVPARSGTARWARRHGAVRKHDVFLRHRPRYRLFHGGRFKRDRHRNYGSAPCGGKIWRRSRQQRRAGGFGLFRRRCACWHARAPSPLATREMGTALRSHAGGAFLCWRDRPPRSICRFTRYRPGCPLAGSRSAPSE
jgi:hypothetical protein